MEGFSNNVSLEELKRTLVKLNYDDLDLMCINHLFEKAPRPILMQAISLINSCLYHETSTHYLISALMVLADINYKQVGREQESASFLKTNIKKGKK